MASGSVATSFSTVENVEHLTKADDIKKAYERLCKEEVCDQPYTFPLNDVKRLICKLSRIFQNISRNPNWT